MAASKTKLAQELTPEALEAFCADLVNVPHGEMASRILEKARAHGISIGRSAAYEFRNKEALPWLRRLQLRKEKAAQLNALAADAGDSARTLADHAAGELSQIVFDAVTELDGRLDLTTKEGLTAFDVLTKATKRLRDGDRAMLEQLQAQVRELQEQQRATAKSVMDAALGAGASPELIATVRQALNFRPPQPEPEGQA